MAEADLEADVARTVLGFLYAISGDIVADGLHTAGWDGHFPAGETLSQQLVLPERLPSWLTEDDVAAFCHENLTGYKRPKIIEFRSDLPKTPVGKVLRRELRDKK